MASDFVNRFSEYLSSRGKRLTREKQIIVEAVLAMNRPFDAEELIEELAHAETSPFTQFAVPPRRGGRGDRGRFRSRPRLPAGPRAPDNARSGMNRQLSALDSILVRRFGQRVFAEDVIRLVVEQFRPFRAFRRATGSGNWTSEKSGRDSRFSAAAGTVVANFALPESAEGCELIYALSGVGFQGVETWIPMLGKRRRRSDSR